MDAPAPQIASAVAHSVPVGAAGASGHPDALPPWLDKSLPWLVSGTMHLGLLVGGLFVLYLARNALHPEEGQQIIIPSSFADPALSNTPGPDSPGTAGDPSRAAAQA